MKKKNANAKMEYTDIIEAIIGGAEAYNLAGHKAQIVTGSEVLANVLVKGFCDAKTDSVDVVLTEEGQEASSPEEEVEVLEAVPVEDAEGLEVVEAEAVEE